MPVHYADKHLLLEIPLFRGPLVILIILEQDPNLFSGKSYQGTEVVGERKNTDCMQMKGYRVSPVEEGNPIFVFIFFVLSGCRLVLCFFFLPYLLYEEIGD